MGQTQDNLPSCLTPPISFHPRGSVPDRAAFIELDAGISIRPVVTAYHLYALTVDGDTIVGVPGTRLLKPKLVGFL